MSNNIEFDDEEAKYTEAEMCYAYTSGYCAGQYRGQVSAIERADELTRSACRTSFLKWLKFVGYED